MIFNRQLGIRFCLFCYLSMTAFSNSVHSQSKIAPRDEALAALIAASEFSQNDLRKILQCDSGEEIVRLMRKDKIDQGFLALAVFTPISEDFCQDGVPRADFAAIIAKRTSFFLEGMTSSEISISDHDDDQVIGSFSYHPVLEDSKRLHMNVMFRIKKMKIREKTEYEVVEFRFEESGTRTVKVDGKWELQHWSPILKSD